MKKQTQLLRWVVVILATSLMATHAMASLSTGVIQPRVAGAAADSIPGPMTNHGGPVQNAPIVYVVFWGWTSDPYGEASYLINFLSGIGGNSWLNTVTEYGGGNPANIFGGSWWDPTPVPSQPTDAQIQSEARSAIIHFGLGATSTYNVQIVVATPTGHSTADFVTKFCAYHDIVGAYPKISYTNLPYIPDAGSTCGAYSVSGILDGVSIVEGHELAESITDPAINAWYDASRNEIADKCSWTNLGTVTTNVGSFAMQPLWSNASNACVMSSAPTPLPPDLTVDGPAGCNGTYSISWTSVANATSYNLWRETPGSTTFTLLRTTSGTGAMVTASSFTQPTQFKVQACIGSSCSAFSNTVGLWKYSGCP